MKSIQYLSRQEALESGIVWPDIYFTPEYGRASEISDQGTWEIAYWPDGPIIYPFLKRKLPPEFDDEYGFDLVSPYGYSGTWARTGIEAARWLRWRREFRRDMRARGAVAEFQRLTSMTGDWRPMFSTDPRLRLTYHHDTVAVDVADYASYWKDCDGRCRTAIRKAKKRNYDVSVRTINRGDLVRSSPFRQLYEQTMRRVGSAPYYLFSDRYFQELFENLATQLRIFEVRDPSQHVSVSGLLLLWPPFVHLHLSGASPRAMRDGAGNLGYDAVIRWACEQPFLGVLHLGGGLHRNDRLFHFKASFSRARLPYHTARSVLDEKKYDQLLGARAEQLQIRPDALSKCDYFPAYRVSTVPTGGSRRVA